MAKVFIQSILFLFGIGSNPVPKQNTKSPSDFTKAAWMNTGMFIRQSMNNYVSQNNAK